MVPHAVDHRSIVLMLLLRAIEVEQDTHRLGDQAADALGHVITYSRWGDIRVNLKILLYIGGLSFLN